MLQEERAFDETVFAEGDAAGSGKRRKIQTLHASFARHIGSSGKKQRMRSRNVVVDQWLGDEGGEEDAYADLEDFLVE